MIYFKENLRYLRKSRGLTQEVLATRLELTRPAIGSYEEGRGVPRLEKIKQIADLFDVTIDSLLTANLAGGNGKLPGKEHDIKILGITVTPDDEERITIVPVKAAAGYLNGRSDTEYLGRLPHFSMPVPELSGGKSYRVFQIKGDSMLPVPPGSYIFCDYLEGISRIQEGKSYVLITSEEGIVFKRLYFHNENELLLKSDNPEYSSYTIEINSIKEIWHALGYLSFNLPDQDTIHNQNVSSAILRLEEELKKLKKEFPQKHC